MTRAVNVASSTMPASPVAGMQRINTTTGSPTITVAGGYRVYSWTASGTITF